MGNAARYVNDDDGDGLHLHHPAPALYPNTQPEPEPIVSIIISNDNQKVGGVVGESSSAVEVCTFGNIVVSSSSSS